MTAGAAGSARGPAEGGGLRTQYRTLRTLLKRNSTALRLLADLEGDLEYLEPHEGRVRASLQALWTEALLMAQELNLLARDRHRALYGALESIEEEIERVFSAAPPRGSRPLGLGLGEAYAEDAGLAGGKTAGLALLRRLHPDHVPEGFTVTTEAYRRFIEANGLLDRILPLLADIDAVTDRDLLGSRTASIREQILRAEVPPEIREEIASRAAALAPEGTSWAVRSSARGEDDRFTFAGQFDSRLRVPASGLEGAYKAVLAGRFTDRAVLYRGYCGLRDVETPMAVLFMPMVDASAAGVLYTVDPERPESERMVAALVPGVSDRMLRGEEPGDRVFLSRERRPRLLLEDGGEAPSYVSSEGLEALGALALEAAETLGYELDIEWAIDGNGHLWLLQGRRLLLTSPGPGRRWREAKAPPFIERGITVAPGRAEGPVEHLPAGKPPTVLRQTVPVAVTDMATPDIVTLLPDLAALLVRGGNPAGHAAALIREFGVPTLFQLGEAVSLLDPGALVSVDASRRHVFHGRRWEGIRDVVLAKSAAAKAKEKKGPLHDLVVALHLTDPAASSFKAGNCRSVHDVIRFVHEQSIRSMFAFGDRQNRLWASSARKLDSPLLFDLRLIDMERPAPARRKVRPEEVTSAPFRAFWRGVEEVAVDWRRRPMTELDWMPREFVEAVTGGAEGPRRRGHANYAVVASDYLNVNARVTYHYAMIDAVVGQGKERNHVHFRARGGGADPARRARRARFLELVLRQSRFVTDRQGDLITAWLRGYPSADCEEALAMLGRLLSCARQLDRIMADDTAPKRWAAEFLTGNYRPFQYSG